MRKPLAMVLVVGGGWLAPSVARADEPTSHEKASSAFVEARKLIDAGDCDGAVPKLRESLSYESSIGARLSIVDCIEQRDALRAWRLLKEASVLAVMNHDDRLSVVEQRAAILQTRLAVIKFTLPYASEQPGFELRVDGVVIDRYVYRYGWATSAGRHVIEASANGQRFTGEAIGEIGKEVTVNVVLEGERCKPAAAPVYVPPPAPIVVDRGATRRAVGLAIGGLGLATIANGVIFGLLTLDQKHSLEAACGGSTSACAAPRDSLDPERESAKTEAAISTASFAIGGAMLLGGAAIYLTAPSANASAPKQGVRFSPRAMRAGGGAFFEGTW
jgi:hypothetical protein